jgi:hypothetical protein
MNINDYSLKVKNLEDALASIGAPVDDENLVAVTLNGLGKDYNQFRTSIVGTSELAMLISNVLS